MGHGGEEKKNLHLHVSTQEILSFSGVSQLTLHRRSFMDSDKAVRLQAPSPDSDRCLLFFFFIVNRPSLQSGDWKDYVTSSLFVLHFK